MRPDELKAEVAKARSRGHLPFFVNATCGTTVLCSFDPLPEIAAICREENLWLHVDVRTTSMMNVARISRQTFHLKPRTIVVVTGMSRWYAVTVGEVSGPIEGDRTVRTTCFSFSFVSLILLLLLLLLMDRYVSIGAARIPWRGIRTRCSARRFSARCS